MILFVAALLLRSFDRLPRPIAGIAAGLAGGLYFATFVRALLFEVEPASPSSLVVPVFCLLVVALAAAWFPARRATHVDPAEALRMD